MKEHILTFDVSREHPEAICMDQKKPERCDWSYRVISMVIKERERFLTERETLKEREKDFERERREKVRRDRMARGRSDIWTG